MVQPFPNELNHLYSEPEFIGSGGFTRVFKAKHRDGRVVAVKSLQKYSSIVVILIIALAGLYIIIFGGSSGGCLVVSENHER